MIVAKSKKPKPKEELNGPEDQLRARVKKYLIQRFYTRFHMSLILMSAGFAAMLGNWLLLHWGVGQMWLRYPVAITFSYLTFLAGVWLWLQYLSFRRGDGNGGTSSNANSRVDGGDTLDIVNLGGGGGAGGFDAPDVVGSGGGSFDGGGASGDWVDANSMQSFVGNPSPSVPAPSGGVSDTFGNIGSKFGDFFDLDGEAIVLIVLALLLVCSVLLLSGYIVWFAPDILGEAVFGATLAGGLAGASRQQDKNGWVMGVVKKTWWPFAIVFAAAMAFAIYAAIHYPAAKTFGEALAAAVAG